MLNTISALIIFILLSQFLLDGPTVIRSGMNLVDPFFYLTGYLTYVMVYPIFSKPGSGWLKMISATVYRLVR